MRRIALISAVLFTAACNRGDRRADTAAVAPDTAPKLVVSVPGFQTPESVRYDEDLDLFFVSNINGNPSMKDGNGYISRVRADGTVDSSAFIRGGHNGVQLDAPKGIAISGDTLWVSDIDAVRAFNRRTGEPVASIALKSMGATFLNDVVIGPDGSVYITDTGIRFDSKGNMTHPGKDRVFRITGRTPKVVVQADSMGSPNGIAWDGTKNRFVIVPFSSPWLFTWQTNAIQPAALAQGPGGYDGVEVLADGRILVSSWADSSIHLFAGESRRAIITGKPAPADFGIDTKRNRIAIPLFNDNVVEIWQLTR